MSKTVRQIYSVALSATTVAVFSGAALAIPAAAGAEMMSSCTFTRSLTVGSRGADVTCLQNALVAGGLLSATPTGYFGSLTKAAVAKWQAAAGVSPAVGFFGAISRAKYAMMMAGSGTMPTTPMTPSTGPVATVPGAGVAVSAAAMQPSGAAIAGAGQIDVAKYTFTASNAAGVTVTNLKLSRTGVVSDSNISNLYLADETGVVFAQYSSLNNGIAMFDGLNMMVNAGQSRVVTLRMDLSSSAAAGNTLGWRLDMATTAGNGAVTGLPVSGPSLTVTTVTNPSLGAVTYTFASSGNTVDAGKTAFLASSATVNVTNSAVLLKSLKFTVVGSANMADLRNATLSVNGAIVATASMVGADGKVVFIPTTDVRIPTGNSTFEVRVDVMGSPNRTMAWNVLRPYDAVFQDTQYNTNVTGTTSGTPTTVTINQGRVYLSRSSDAPPASVSLGTSNVTLAKFALYTSGEPMKFRFLPVAIRNVGDASGAINGDIRNISITDNLGNSLGTTISSPTGNWASSAATFNFGTSSSYINYIVPANTTRVLSVKVDILSTADISGLTASLVASIGNVEGQGSLQTSNTGNVTGNPVTITTSESLQLSTDPNNVPAQYLAMGSTDQVLYKLKLTAGSAEDVRIRELSFMDSIENNAPGLASFANFRLYDESNSSFAGPVSMALSGTGTGTVGFTETADFNIVVPKNGSRTLTLKADVAQYVSGAAKSGSRHTFGIPLASAVRAFGKDSGLAATVFGTPAGTPQTVYRTKPRLTTALIGPTTGRFRLAVDDVATLNWQNAGALGDVKIGTVKIKFAGPALANGTPSFSAGLIDTSTNSLWGDTAQLCAPSGGSCSVTFSPNFVISSGSAKQVKLRVDSSNFANPSVNGETVSITIDAASDITWSDGTSNGIVWGENMPITIATVSYE